MNAMKQKTESNVAKRGALQRCAALALLVNASCAHSGAIAIPNECEPISYRQEDAIRELIRIDIFGQYVYPELQPVADVLSAYSKHCQEDDALVGR